MTDASTASLEDLRFPIGRFSFPETPVPGDRRAELVDTIAATPAAAASSPTPTGNRYNRNR